MIRRAQSDKKRCSGENTPSPPSPRFQENDKAVFLIQMFRWQLFSRKILYLPLWLSPKQTWRGRKNIEDTDRNRLQRKLICQSRILCRFLLYVLVLSILSRRLKL